MGRVKGREDPPGTLCSVKLCRFELLEQPGSVRSGLYYDGRIYETDGKNAIGIHEVDQIRLHAPIGQPPSIKAFHVTRSSAGEEMLYYSYLHSAQLHGPNAEHELPDLGEGFGGWDFEARICAVLSDTGSSIQPDEGDSFILGYTILCQLCPPAESVQAPIEVPTAILTDGGSALGPFVITPEEIAEYETSERSTYSLEWVMTVNETEIAQGVWKPEPIFPVLLNLASQVRPLLAGEIVAHLPLPKPTLEDSPLGRGIVPGDVIHVKLEGLGILASRIV